MKNKRRKLWIRALYDDENAYRKLGEWFWNKKKDKELSKLCLEKAMELGDEKAFIYYHLKFSKGKQVIDDRSYDEVCREYQTCENKKRKNVLKQYLKLGTSRQRKK